MITFKIGSGDRQVTVESDNFEDAARLINLTTRGSTQASSEAPKQPRARASSYRRGPSQRPYKRWTMEEAQALIANLDKSDREISMLPEFAGRTRKSVALVRGYVRGGKRVAQAPAVVQEAFYAHRPMAVERTGLLD